MSMSFGYGPAGDQQEMISLSAVGAIPKIAALCNCYPARES